MTTMTIVDVCDIKYPGQRREGNITFGKDFTGPIFITSWNVAGIEKPTEEYLESLIPDYQYEFDLDYFINYGIPMLEQYIDSVAQQRQYGNAVSCASYANSTVLKWNNESNVFIAWRDAVYTYALAQQELMQNRLRTIPLFEEFQTELPVINWPTEE